MFMGFILLGLSSLFLSSSAGILQQNHFVLTAKENSQPLGEALSRMRRSSSEARVRRFHVSSKVTSRYSRVHITSDVSNDATTAQEVSVELRLPKTAFISNFSMEIDSVIYVGVVKAKAVAKAEYEQAVAQGQSAGLVTASVREVQNFAVSVNIAAGTMVTFRLEYQEFLVRKLGLYKHVIYADPGQVVDDLMVEVVVSEPIGISTLEATGPKVSGRGRDLSDPFDIAGSVEIRRSKSQGYIKYRPSADQQRAMRNSDKSFTVSYDVIREELGGEIMIKNGYFVHFFAPTHLPVIPKNIVFIIDRSGSMVGSKIKQTKEALKMILEDLNEEDHFNILSFSSESNVLQRGEMMSVNRHNIRRARRYVNAINANGGTNMHGALIDGISLLNTISGNAANSFEQASMIIVMTDGQPTVGITDTNQIIHDATQGINGRFSLFCLGFGSDVDHTFLQKLAHQNRGTSRQIFIDSDVHLQLKGFYDEVASPLLTHVILKYRGIPTDKLTTNKFHNHFDGAEIMVVGRLLQPGRTPAPAEEFGGFVEGRSVDGDVSIFVKGKEMEESFLDEDFNMEKLWAYLTIKDLLRNKTHNADNEEQVLVLDAEILRLSLKFNFVTPLTSMVVTKPGDDVLPPPFPPIDPIPDPIPFRPRTLSRGPFQTMKGSRMRSFSPHRYSMPSSSAMMIGGSHASNSRFLQRPPVAYGPPAPSSCSGFHCVNPSSPAGRKLMRNMMRMRHRQQTTTSTTTTTPAPTTTIRATTTPFVNPIPTDPLRLESTCGDTIFLTSAVNITSPQYPGLYPKNSQCVWRINLGENLNSDENTRIRLAFQRLDLEGESTGSCNRDRILIYPDFDSNSMHRNGLVRTRCGYSEDVEFVEASRNLVVVFQSDEVVSGRGFLASVDVLGSDV